MKLRKLGLLAIVPLFIMSTGLHAGDGGHGGNGDHSAGSDVVDFDCSIYIEQIIILNRGGMKG